MINKPGIIVILYKKEKDGIKYALFKRKEDWVGYEFLKGGMEKGETPIQTAIRELKEEAGLSYTKLIQSKHNYSFESKKNGETVFHGMVVFFQKIASSDKIIIDNQEHSAVDFFEPKKLIFLLPFDSLKDLFRKVHEEILNHEKNDN
ncbi:MAG: NUDIX domain-containing protein [Nanoarchaeota archaeon]|nr:NUDIX domain-containing protein [Nanoarchaeota archaeon]MBU1029771.1 NUDIX domain-containing protein [Nanoarchaeota archaeon]MBU1850447.1 NUDIX domain-containing protein [Nanoarchaeota archaeon]